VPPQWRSVEGVVAALDVNAHVNTGGAMAG